MTPPPEGPHELEPTFDCAAMLRAADDLDVDRFMSFTADDVDFRFGNAHPVRGREALQAVIEDFFSSVRHQQHAVTRVLRDGTCVVVIMDVTYTRHDGTTVTLPAVDVLHTSGGRVTDYRIYMDASPL